MKTIMHHFASVLSVAMLLLGGNVQAQEVIAASGGHFQNPNWTIAFTLGEVVSATQAQGGTVITQGFHQPPDDFSTMVAEVMDAQAEVLAFPNPARDEVTLVVNGVEGQLQLELFDATGRNVRATERFTERTLLDANALASGNYHIRLSTASGYLTTVQLAISH